MILPDREIKLALQGGRIVIEPTPDNSLFSATSVDLTLHDKIRRWIKAPIGVKQTIAPGVAGYNYNEVQKSLTEPVEPTDGGFTINPV